MEDDYLQENVGYAFLTTQEAISIFADVDYALKSGKHIQKCPSQGKQFAFVGKYYDKLKSYYDNLFDIHLNREGEGDLEYFFIDFFKDGNGYYQRGNIPVENREYLAESHLIIAFLLIRMYVLEPRAESRILIQDFKVQVLSEYEEIEVCTDYELNGKLVEDFPFTDVLDECKPVFKTVKGWNTDISQCRKKEDLPKAALDYIAFIEKACDCRIKYVSVGAEREAYVEMY